MKVSLYALMENVIKPVIGDFLTKALTTMDFFHHETHEGRAFNLTGTITLPAGGVYEILIITPDTTRWIHLDSLSAESDASLTATLYVDSSRTDASGNRLTPSNRDFNSANTTVATLCHTPGGSGDGTQKWSKTVAADHPLSDGASVQGSARKEWILKQNSAHLIKFEGAENDVINYELDWYEHQPD